MHERTQSDSAPGGVDIDPDEEHFAARDVPRWKRALHVLLPLAVLAAGAAAVWLLFATAPEPEREPPAFEGATVEIVRARAQGARPTLQAFGNVAPAHEVEVVPEVEGKVQEVSPELVPGGLFARGETMLRIDPRDFRLAIAAQESAIAEARLTLARERAERVVAERTRALFPEDAALADAEGAELALREPQLRSARAQLAAAQAQLEQGRLDLARTRIEAPFDAVVVSESVDPGQRVSPQQPIATLAGVDAYHVEVSVPVRALSHIRAAGADGEGGSRARVRTTIDGREHAWEAHVGPLAPQVTERGSMAQLTVVVPSPRGEEREVPLLLGSFVEVVIFAEPIEGAVAIPRAALHGEDEVWIATDAGTLDVRHVAVAWTDEERALIASGVAPDERVIVSRIAAPVEGMRVRVARDEAEVERRLEASLGARPAE